MNYQSTRSYSVKIKPNNIQASNTDIQTENNISHVYEVLDSCMHMDTMPVYQKVKFDNNRKNNKNQEHKNKLDGNSDLKTDIKNIKTKKEKVKFSGTRDKRLYTFKQGKEVVLQGKTYRKIHADINGALNIPRKVFKGFNPQGLLSLNYEVIGKSTSCHYRQNKSKKYNNDKENQAKYDKKLKQFKNKDRFQSYFTVIYNYNMINKFSMPTSKGCSSQTIGS